MTEAESFELLKRQFYTNLKDGLINLQIDWLIKKVEQMNDSLHLIQIITSTMDDSELVEKIFKIADESQLAVEE
ncbi:hypothetical protein [Bacillus infantis]|uniref:hypothetical protein n=1 Tax=Bacillus infantis TaxID=324767 RepID=UPI003CFA7DE8